MNERNWWTWGGRAVVTTMLLGLGCGPAGGDPAGAPDASDVGVRESELANLGVTLRMNSGPNTYSPYTADTGFSGGTASGPVTGVTINKTGVTNPAPDGVYLTGRTGDFTYTLSGFAAGTNNLVRLHFAELDTAVTTSNPRKFDVKINSATVLTNFNIYATAGNVRNKAVVQSFTVPSNTAGKYVIQFISKTTKKAWVSGIEITPPAPCANGASAAQTFTGDMVGCKGAVSYANRATLCAPGFHVASAAEWATYNNKVVPTHNYWTDDFLGYSGNGPSSCAATSLGVGTQCDQPMRVCTAAGSDPEGNACNWTQCGLNSKGPNYYFGGCSGNTTAGTLCVRSVCANGEAAESFGGGMIGCKGTSGQSGAVSLCATDRGYHEASTHEWTSFRANQTPAYDYWVTIAPGYATGSDAMCLASQSADGGKTACANRMHVCTATGGDSLGNTCDLAQCGYESNSPNQFLGGCATGSTGGALCVHANPIGCKPGNEDSCRSLDIDPAPTGRVCAGVPWPNGVIYYGWADPFDDAVYRRQIRASMDYWESITGGRIRFTEDAEQPARVMFTCRNSDTETACPAGGVGGVNPIGYASGNSNSRVAYGRIYKLDGVADPPALPLPAKFGWDTHELGHVIGFFHEQERGDRNRYTYRNPINYPYAGSSETRCDIEAPGSNFGVYDPLSTMHYHAQTINAGEPPIISIFKPDMLTPANSFSDLQLANAKDASNVLERYAALRAWTRWYSLGRDLGEHMPLDIHIPSPPATSASVTIKSGKRPAVASQGGVGNVDIYVLGSDSHIYRHAMGSGGDFWEDLGGTYDTEPAATSWGASSSIVLAAKSGVISWRKLTSAGWGSWATLPALPAALASGSGPAVITRGADKLSAFYRATNNNIYQNTYNGSWGTWTAIPAAPGVTWAASPAASTRAADTFDVFATSSSGHIFHIAYDNAWATWEDLAGNADPASSPAAASWSKWRVDVVYRGTDTLLYGRRWDQTWRDIESLGGIMHSSPAAVTPKVGRLEVYALGADDGLWRRIHQPARNDFDGDGKADRAVMRGGDWHIVRSSDGAEEVTTFGGLASDKFVPGDFDGDGRLDKNIFRDGSWIYTYSASGVMPLEPAIWGTNDDRPAVGDYDGDGLTDLALFRPSTFTWWIFQSSGQPVRADLWGTTGDVPVPADYDGDGRTDVAVIHTDFTWATYASGPVTFPPDVQFGTAGDIPVPADYDGDGKADRAVYRPSTSQWFRRLSSTDATVSNVFGDGANAIPQPGDYDGDGKADLAYFNSSLNNWYIQPSSGIAISPYAFASGDKPVTFVLAP